jgi:hypothetical protein
MSHHRHHHEDRHHEDRHHEDRHREHHRARLQQALRRRLRRHGGDVDALEELQRDLEQAAADVAARVAKLREKSSTPEPAASEPAPSEPVS